MDNAHKAVRGLTGFSGLLLQPVFEASSAELSPALVSRLLPLWFLPSPGTFCPRLQRPFSSVASIQSEPPSVSARRSTGVHSAEEATIIQRHIM